MLITSAFMATVCLSPIPTLDADDRQALALLGEGVVIGPAEVPPVSESSNWLPLVDAVSTFVRTSGNSKGSTEQVSLQGAISEANEWTQHAPNRWTRYLHQSDEGIHVPTSINIPHAVISKYEPPEPLVLPGVAAGQPVEHDIKGQVYDIHDPTVLAHSGSLRAIYHDLGGFRITVPAGTFDARLIKVSYDGKVGPATITDASWAFYAEGVGPIAYVNYKDVSAFLIYHQDERYGTVLQSSESATQSSPPTKSDPS